MFSVNFEKFPRTAFPQNISGQLLLLIAAVDKTVFEKENSTLHSQKIRNKFHVASRCRKSCWQKVVDIKTKSDWLLKFQPKKSVKKVENLQFFFAPTFSVLFSDIAQSCFICACTQENLGTILSLLGFFNWMEKDL